MSTIRIRGLTLALAAFLCSATAMASEFLVPRDGSIDVDPSVQGEREGPSFATRVGAGGYAPLLSGAKRFGPSFCTAFGAAWSLPFLRGLYAGFEAAFSGADYRAGEAEYAFFSLRPEVAYRFLFGGGTRLVDRLVPFVALAAGPAYVGVESAATNPTRYGDLIAAIGLAAGVECSISAAIALRLEARAEAYAQEGAPFVTAGGLFSVVYER